MRAGLGKIVDGGGRGRNLVAFTSGGAVAAAVGLALGLADEKVIEISWRVRNAAVTELLFSPANGREPAGSGLRWTLHTFNTTPHLVAPGKVTYI